MNNTIAKEEFNIENMIYEVRGKQVMLDSDLAKLYRCTNGTKTINQAVSRHKDRFPDDFYFQLTKEEYDILRSQSGTAKSKMIRFMPYAFTEHGVAMLATILRTDIATKISIDIMRAFVAMKKYISYSYLEQTYMKNMLLKHDNDIKLLQESFKKFDEKKKVNEIYYKGQIYDAYSKIVDILKTAKKEIIIIDNYADKTILDIIRSVNINVILITKTTSNLTKVDLKKYRSQYHNLTLIYNDSFHDRYFIIDKCEVYHCGASVNHAGSKIFGINILQDDIAKKGLIAVTDKIIKTK